MRVRYMPGAERHMRAIGAHLPTQSPAGMRSVTRRIREAVELLARFPEIGHAGVLAGTGEIVVPVSRASSLIASIPMP